VLRHCCELDAAYGPWRLEALLHKALLAYDLAAPHLLHQRGVFSGLLGHAGVHRWRGLGQAGLHIVGEGSTEGRPDRTAGPALPPAAGTELNGRVGRKTTADDTSTPGNA
jgi:hypothetical protein